MKTAEYWIDKLGLRAHPEGGFFKETYRSTEEIKAEALPDRYKGPRSFGTAIYFLIHKNAPSNFHKIESDELWFFHAGDSLRVYVLEESLEYWEQDIGPDPEMNQRFQVLLPKGSWFAAEVISPGTYGLISCTVSPGFDFSDFTLAKREELKAQFPDKEILIDRLTKA
jgi:uncharacterized protein